MVRARSFTSAVLVDVTEEVIASRRMVWPLFQQASQVPKGQEDWWGRPASCALKWQCNWSHRTESASPSRRGFARSA
jgi:hypothetical protein